MIAKPGGRHPRLVNLAEMAWELCDAVNRTTSRIVYQGAYALSIALPGKTRGKKQRAAIFATKIEENAQKHAPAGIAILLNAIVFLLLGTLRIREERGGDPASISLTVGTEDFAVKSIICATQDAVGIAIIPTIARIRRGRAAMEYRDGIRGIK